MSTLKETTKAMSEKQDYIWFGADYVIAGRMLDILGPIRDWAILEDDPDRNMRLWMAAQHIVKTRRTVRMDTSLSTTRRRSGL